MPFKCKLTIKVTRIPSAIGMLMWLLFLCKIKYDIEQVVGIQCDPSKTTHGGDKSPWDRSAGQVLGFWVSFLTKHQRGPDRGEAQAQDPSSLTGAWAAGGEPLSMFRSDPHNSTRVLLPPCWPTCCEKAPWVWEPLFLPGTTQGTDPVLPPLFFPLFPCHVLPGCAFP